MRLSIIVPFYNAEETLADCLESLLHQVGVDCEVIAVDNGSTDQSLEIARRIEARAGASKLRVVEEPRRGQRYALNHGAAEAKGELFLFTDADCVADPNWAAQMEKAFASHPEIAGAGGRVRGFLPNNIVQKFLCLYTLRSGWEEEKLFESFDLFEGLFPTANFAVRRAAFEKLGGFDAQVPFLAGDFDFCARIYAMGWKLLHVPSARVLHQHRSKVGPMMRQSYVYGGAQAVLLAKYFPRDWIVELPGKILRGTGAPRPVWINLTLLDKKVFAGLIAAAVWPPLGLFLLGYAVYWMMQARRIAREDGISLSRFEAAQLFGLMFLKSLAMSSGRAAGGVQMKAVCW